MKPKKLEMSLVESNLAVWIHQTNDIRLVQGNLENFEKVQINLSGSAAALHSLGEMIIELSQRADSEGHSMVELKDLKVPFGATVDTKLVLHSSGYFRDLMELS